MSKEIHALKDRSGQIFWPATATDAIIHPKTRSSLTDHIEKYNLTGDNTIDSLEDGIAKLVTLGISQHLGVQIEILNTSGILEEWTYYDPSKLFSDPAGWRRGGEVDDTLDATSENPVQNKVIYQALVENEEITASALTDLDDRVSDLEDYDLNTRVSNLESIDYEPRFQEIEETIDQNEEVTTEALCNLDSRIRDIEAGSTTGEVINFSETKYIDVVEGNGTDISSGDVSGRQFTVTEDDYYSEEIDNFYPNLEVRYSTTESGVVYIPLFSTGSNETLTFTSNQVRVGDYNYLAEIDNNYLNIRRTLAGTGSIRTLPVPNTSTPLAVGDTYDEAFGKIKKIISDNEVVTAAGLTDLNRRVLGVTESLTTKADLVGGKVPAAQLPSYVDDVLEYEDLAHFPQEGETGKIYVALDTNLTYRWSGTAYIEISKSIVPYVIDLSNINFGSEEDDSSNGAFEFGGGMHDWYQVSANNLPAEIDINNIISAIDNKQNIYFTDNYSSSFNNYLVTYSYKDITSGTRIQLEARTIDNNSVYWINFWYSSSYGLTITKGSWPFRKDVNQIKNSIVILPGSVISGLLDPNAEVEANSYYAMDMGKFTNGSAIGAVLYTHQELFNILAGSTSFSSDANLIRPILFFEGLDQVTSIIDLSPMQVVSVDFSLYSSASGQNLVLVAEGEEHKYTVEIEKDVTTKPINIITSDKDYSNQEINDLIEEVELVTAAGFNNLNERVLQNKSDIDELEEVTSVSLNGLNERVEDLEDDVKNIEEIVDKGHLQEIKWAELKDLRDNSQLIPGYFYRITDYKCTTTQENTQSAGHQFDIVLLALSENKLAEDSWAMMHDNIYDVTFDNDITKKCWIYRTAPSTCNVVDIETLLGAQYVEYSEFDEIDEDNKTASLTAYQIENLQESNLTYNYFQNCKPEAWKLKYRLDNDTKLFEWADPIDGKGIVYYMKDEFDNECPYDFKNIQFKRCNLNSFSGSNKYAGNTNYTNLSYETSGYHFGEAATSNQFSMNREDFDYYYTFSTKVNGKIIDTALYYIQRVLEPNKQTAIEQFGGNIIKPRRYTVTATYPSGSLVITEMKTRLNNNLVFDINCNNIFEDNCYNNVTKGSRNKFEKGSFFNICFNSTDNLFGTDSYCNIMSTSSYNNIGREGYLNIFYSNSRFNMLGNSCHGVKLYESCYNIIQTDCSYINFGGYCNNNYFSNSCNNISLYNHWQYNTFGAYCNNISTNNSKAFYRYITIESGNQYIYLNCTTTTSSSQYYQNVTVVRGVNNTTTIKTISDSNVNQNFQTIYKPANCQEISV